MPNRVLKRFKIPVALLLVALLVLNIPIVQGSDEDHPEDANDLGESRILTDEEVEELGIEPPTREPTRSEPWNKWERIGYHRGGEEGAAVYHAEHNGIYVYGGGQPTQQGHTTYDDMFFFDLATQKWEALERYNSPGGRYRFSEAYDPVEDKLYIYGGFFQGSEANDLWEFNFTSLQWNKLNSGVFPDVIGDGSDARRTRAPMVVDPIGQKLYIHMGQGDNTYNDANLSGFYSIDLTNVNGQPTRLRDGTADGIEKRYGHDMCIDPDNRKIYMYGGIHYNGGWNYDYLNELWIYDMISNTWSQLPLTPGFPTLEGTKMFFRPSDDTVNLWGGYNRDTYTNSDVLWSYDTGLGSWTNDTFTDPPTGRQYYHNGYSIKADRFAVFGGKYENGNNDYRFRDMNYLDLSSMSWTQYDNVNFPGSTSNGIFAYKSDQRRLYYIGPLRSSGWGGNGTEYIYYWDLDTQEWMGPIYNDGDDLPEGRSNSGICYDEENNTAYLYGGGYTTGSWQNREYHDLADFYKLNLGNGDYEQIFPSAGPGERQGFDMVFNSNDGKVYFYGGYQHPTTASEIEIYNDFWSYDPQIGIFNQISLTGTTPGGRRGAALCLVDESNTLYLFGGEENTAPNPTERRDLWKYEFSTGTWTKLDQISATRIQAELDYDPLTKELYLTGGNSDDIYRYRILEDAWYLWYPLPNPGTLSGGHGSFFVPEDRDLWIWGGGAKSGIWKIGIPPRLAIQTAVLEDPDIGTDVVHAMYRDYTLTSRIKVVNNEDDLDKITFELPHRNGVFKIIYNRTLDEGGSDPWNEVDNNDYATLTSEPTVSWNGLFATFTFDIMFHWNWSDKANAVDRILKVKAYGIQVDGDELIVRDFLKVRNNLEFTGKLSVKGEIQGDLEPGEWVQTGETLTFSGPKVAYAGSSDFYPPADSYDLKLFFRNELRTEIDLAPGDVINITIPSENRSYSQPEDYKINVSGINEEIGAEPALTWDLNFDGTPPQPPEALMMHADDYSDSRINYDNDQEVFATWYPAEETASGVKVYYWSYEDNGGTRDGIEMNLTQMIVDLPQTGINTIYVWAEDNVGNIGDAASASILVDNEGIDFTVISPELNETIPYTSIDIVFNMTELGGSKIIPETIQYRYTFNGQADDMWIGSNAWAYLPDLWGQGAKDTIEFTLGIGKDTIKLSDSDENFVQIRATDGAGNTHKSPVYNIKVDTSLRFPDVTLLSPEDGAEFESAEDIVLKWEVDFFDPQDVVYNLYISEVKEKVELQEEGIKEQVFDTEFSPNWLYFGKYYWTIIPVAKGQWTGSCLSGIWSLEITNDENFAFKVDVENTGHKYQQGQGGIPIAFTLENQGQDGAWIKPTADLNNIAVIETWAELGEDGYILQIGSSREVVCLLKIKDNASVGVHDLIFYFESDKGINRSAEISVEVIERIIEGDDDTDENEGQIGIIVAFGIVGLIALLFIIGVLYFVVLKKKKKGVHFDDSHLDELERELDSPMGKDDDLEISSFTKELSAGSKKQIPPPVDSEKLPPAQAEVPQEDDEPVKLAEDGSEDDWMNLVAKETMQIESMSEVEEDKTVHDEEKSLQDILAEMSGDVELEDD